MNRFRFMFFCVVIGLCFLSAYAFTFDTKINLGGDNLSYYYLGKSLIMGLGYSDIYSANITPHTHFPPGYPVIISGWLMLFDGVVPIKILNGIFGVGALIIGFLFFRKVLDSDWISLLLIVFISLNRHMLEYSSIMMSEIPFLFFLMLGLWLFVELDYNQSWYRNTRFILLVVTAVAVFYIRSFGIILMTAAILDLLIKRRIGYALVLLSGFLILTVPWSIRNSMLSRGSGYVNQLLMINPYDASLGTLDMSSLLERVGENVLRYCDKEIIFLFSNFSEIDYDRDYLWINVCLSLALLALLTLGLLAMNKNREFLIGLVVSAAGILVLWPSQWFGVRFLLPMLIVAIGLIVNGLLHLVDKTSFKQMGLKVIMIGLVLASFGQLPEVMALNARRNQDYPDRYRDYFSASIWIRQNSDEDNVVACRKPLLSYHFSQRPSIRWINTSDPHEIIRSFSNNDVDYVIVDVLGYASTGQNILPLFRQFPEKLAIVKKMEKTPTFIGKYTSYLGYSGSIVDGKKDGFGIYRWPNGTSYRGQWKNDLRNGRGTLLGINSDKEIYGIWRNDTLVKVLSKEESVKN